jgi:hypothetical protein
MKKTLYRMAIAIIATMFLVVMGCTKKASTPVQAPVRAAVQAAPVEIAEVEPNDIEETAQLINIGATVKGSFATEDDEDYYKITLASSGKLTAYTEGASDIYILWIEELDEDGDYAGNIASGEYITDDNEGDKRVEADLVAGTYCLYLEGYDAGPYTLKTSFTAGPVTATTQTTTPATTQTTTPAQTRTTPAQATTSTPGGTNWDSLLDQYEKFVDDYVAAMQKAAAGDFSAMTTAMSLMEQANSLSEKLTSASTEISAAQSVRLLRIQTKLTEAASSLL